MYFEAAIVLLCLNQALAIVIPPPDTDCDHQYKVKRDGYAEIKSPRWPHFYKKNKVCRWIVDCPVGFVCRLRCHDMAVPETAECNADAILISTVGSNWLVGADKYCGSKYIDVRSTNYRITIGLISSTISPGGKFRCQVTPELRETD